MNKFLAFLLNFSILNSSFAEDLLCPCCYNNYFKNYQDGKSFATDGLDVYVVDDFTNDKNFNGANIFDNYYKHFFEEDKEDPFLPKEQYNINTFMREENPSNELHFSSHENPWYWHIYKKEEDSDLNNNLIENIAKKMSTEGGNNFNWEEGKDEPRPFESYRSKIRHNKNVIIIKLKDPSDTLFKETIYTFRKFVNMSYVPNPIIFTGNFDYGDFVKDLKRFNDEYTRMYKEEEIGKIEKGMVDHKQEISERNCLYVKQDGNFVSTVKNELRLAANYHNSKAEEFKGETFNVVILGWKRSGKTTLANIILDSHCAKAANDFASVTRDQTKFFHKSVREIPISVIDTPGFEEGEHYAENFKNWLQKPCEEDVNKTNADNVHAIIYIINAQNFPQPEKFGGEWCDSDGNKMGNELFTKEEVELFKIFKDEKIPVVFNIARSGSFKKGYKYLRKFFGDLILINELSDYQNEEEENWSPYDQWFSINNIRSNLIQLKNDKINGETTGKYGLIRLFDCIYDLYISNNEYKKKLPSFFQNEELGQQEQDKVAKLKCIFDSLKKQFIEKDFKNDKIEAPLNIKNNDLIMEIFEKGLMSSLKTLHENRENTRNHEKIAKQILNYVCSYDYDVDKEVIAREVTAKTLKKYPSLSVINRVSKTPFVGAFIRCVSAKISGIEGTMEEVIHKMILSSLPPIKLAKKH